LAIFPLRCHTIDYRAGTFKQVGRAEYFKPHLLFRVGRLPGN
jgi:hypothetical protein